MRSGFIEGGEKFLKTIPNEEKERIKSPILSLHNPHDELKMFTGQELRNTGLFT